MAQTITLSSVGTAQMVLNPVAKSTTFLLTSGTASSLGTAVIDISLDDPSSYPAPTMTWATISSATLGSSVVTVAVTYTVLSPVGAARINSTTTGAGTWTLKALQSVTA